MGLASEIRAMPRRLLAPLAAAVMAVGCVGVPPDEATHERSSQAIVGGQPTDRYPAVPVLRYTDAADDSAGCSGTLISPRVVLTAAHCIPSSPPTTFVAYFGSNATVEDDPAFLGLVEVDRFIANERFVLADPEAGYDIGLVLLAEPAPVAPMPYLRRPLLVSPGKQVRSVGWGITRAEGSDAFVKREVANPLIEASEMLLEFGTADRGICSGDSGGPAFMTIDGVETVVGVNSFVYNDCVVSFAGRVDRYTDDLIAPFVAEFDPDATCVTDAVCEAGCAFDPDCGGASGIGGDVVGGCAAGGGSAVAGPLALALALALAARRRPAG